MRVTFLLALLLLWCGGVNCNDFYSRVEELANESVDKVKSTASDIGDKVKD